MLDFKQEIVEALSPILPTYYEYVCDSKTPQPCITYAEYLNSQDKTRGDNIGWSNVGYTIKVWGDSIKDITEYSNSIDAALRPLGYTRDSSNELLVGNKICKILKYIAYCDEHFNERN